MYLEKSYGFFKTLSEKEQEEVRENTRKKREDL